MADRIPELRFGIQLRRGIYVVAALGIDRTGGNKWRIGSVPCLQVLPG
ncbi:MAG: hypothetical protein JO159_06060 [Acidobacteria bacterium]|nr:hypothetical protein [Acidobacteriota bacterium]